MFAMIDDKTIILLFLCYLSNAVTPQKYPRIFIIILLYILGMNWAKLGFFSGK